MPVRAHTPTPGIGGGGADGRRLREKPKMKSAQAWLRQGPTARGARHGAVVEGVRARDVAVPTPAEVASILASAAAGTQERVGRTLPPRTASPRQLTAPSFEPAGAAVDRRRVEHAEARAAFARTEQAFRALQDGNRAVEEEARLHDPFHHRRKAAPSRGTVGLAGAASMSSLGLGGVADDNDDEPLNLNMAGKRTPLVALRHSGSGGEPGGASPSSALALIPRNALASQPKKAAAGPAFTSAAALADFSLSQAEQLTAHHASLRREGGEATLAPAGLAEGGAAADEKLAVATAALCFWHMDRAGALPPVMTRIRAILIRALFPATEAASRREIRMLTEATPPTHAYASDPPCFFDLDTYREVQERATRIMRLPRARVVAELLGDEQKVAASHRGMRRAAERAVVSIAFRGWRQVTRTRPLRLAHAFLETVTKVGDTELRGRYFSTWRELVVLNNGAGEHLVSDDEGDEDHDKSARPGINKAASTLAAIRRIRTLAPSAMGRQESSAGRSSTPAQSNGNFRASLEANRIAVEALQGAESHIGQLQKQLTESLTALRHYAANQPLVQRLLKDHKRDRLANGIALPDDHELRHSDEPVSAGSFGASASSVSGAYSIMRTDALTTSERAMKESQEVMKAVTAHKSNFGSDSDAAAPLAFVEKVPVEDMLLAWSNDLLGSTGISTSHMHAASLDLSFVDGRIFVAMASYVFPAHGLEVLMPIEPASKRIDAVLEALRNVGVEYEDHVTANDIATGGIGTEVLLATLFRAWHASCKPELENPSVDINNMDQSMLAHMLQSTRLLYTFAETMRLPRMLGKGFEILADRITVWLETRLMSRIRESNLEGGRAQDLGDFTTVKPDHFGELKSCLADAHVEAEKVAVVLKDSYTELRKVFDFYRAASMQQQQAAKTAAAVAAGMGSSTGLQSPRRSPTSAQRRSMTPPPAGAGSSGGGGGHATDLVAGVSAREMMRLMEDSKLFHRAGVSKGAVLAVFDVLLLRQIRTDVPDEAKATAMYRQECSNGSNVTGGGLAHTSLYFTKPLFIETLVRVSSLAVSGAGKHLESGVVAAVLKSVLEDNIFPNAMSSAKLEFKRLVADRRVQDVFENAANTKTLVQIYRHYSTLDSQTGRSVMTQKQFVAMLVELGFIDKAMTKADVRAIFTDVQDDEGEGGDEVGETMSYSEFTEAMAAVAMFKSPHPLKSVHIRLQSFLDATLIPLWRSHSAITAGKDRRAPAADRRTTTRKR